MGRRGTNQGITPERITRFGTDEGHGRVLELVEEPDRPQGTWHFGEGTIHHHAFDVVSADNQQAVKDWIVGLGVRRPELDQLEPIDPTVLA